MAVTVYQYPNCSTCKRALKWLDAHAIPYESIDLVTSPPSKATLEQIASLANAPLKKLFNVAGESYRAGDFKSKLPQMSDAQAYAALAKDGKLIKRPLLLDSKFALIGFDPAAWESRLVPA